MYPDNVGIPFVNKSWLVTYKHEAIVHCGSFFRGRGEVPSASTIFPLIVSLVKLIKFKKSSRRKLKNSFENFQARKVNCFKIFSNFKKSSFQIFNKILKS